MDDVRPPTDDVDVVVDIDDVAEDSSTQLRECEHEQVVDDLAPNGESVQVLVDGDEDAREFAQALATFISSPISIDPSEILELASFTSSAIHQLECLQSEIAMAWILVNPPVADEDDFSLEDLPATAGGEGAPDYRGGSSDMFALAANRTLRSTQRYFSHVGELITRLPLTWQKVKDLQVPMWQARRLTDMTQHLSPCAAAALDAELSPHIRDVKPAQLKQAIAEVEVMHMPEYVAQRTEAEIAQLGIGVDTRNTTTGTCDLVATLDVPDAMSFYNWIHRAGEYLVQEGIESQLGVAQSRALGMLGRGELNAMEFVDPELIAWRKSEGQTGQPHGIASAEINLYVHFGRDQLTQNGGGGTALVEGFDKPVLMSQIAQWCRQPEAKIRVRPIIDLAGSYSSPGYAPGRQLREQVIVRDQYCVFPGCTSKARRSDLDHTLPYNDGGETKSENLAALCRKHHRAKTRRQWDYEIRETEYEWKLLRAYLAAKHLRVRKNRPLWFRFPGNESYPEITQRIARTKALAAAQVPGANADKILEAAGIEPPPF